LEVTKIRLGQDGKNWSDPCSVLRTPPRGWVGRTGGVVALLSLLISFIVYKVWLKGTPTKALEEGGSITFSFNFPFPLEVIF